MTRTIRRTLRVFLLLFIPVASLAAYCAASISGAQAQAENTITVRMLDSKTGNLIASNNFLIRVNHQQEVHGNWVTQSEDGTGKLTLPAGADTIQIHATYENATLIYANCDVDKDKGSAEHAPALDHWYPVAPILSSGTVAPNDCVGKKVPEKLQVVAKPGEFVFFVRQLNTRERFKD